MKKYLFPIMIGAVLLVFTDWYFITRVNHSYQEKFQILSVMIEEQEKMASEAKHHSIGEYIGAFFIPLTLPPSFGHDKRKVFSLFRIFLFYCFMTVLLK